MRKYEIYWGGGFIVCILCVPLILLLHDVLCVYSLPQCKVETCLCEKRRRKEGKKTWDYIAGEYFLKLVLFLLICGHETHSYSILMIELWEKPVKEEEERLLFSFSVPGERLKSVTISVYSEDNCVLGLEKASSGEEGLLLVVDRGGLLYTDIWRKWFTTTRGYVKEECVRNNYGDIMTCLRCSVCVRRQKKKESLCTLYLDHVLSIQKRRPGRTTISFSVINGYYVSGMWRRKSFSVLKREGGGYNYSVV